MLPHLSGVPHLHVNRPKSLVDCVAQSVGIFLLIIELKRLFQNTQKGSKKILLRLDLRYLPGSESLSYTP